MSLCHTLPRASLDLHWQRNIRHASCSTAHATFPSHLHTLVPALLLLATVLLASPVASESQHFPSKINGWLCNVSLQEQSNCLAEP